VIRRRRAEERAIFAEQQGASAAGADVNTQNRNGVLPDNGGDGANGMTTEERRKGD